MWAQSYIQTWGQRYVEIAFALHDNPRLNPLLFECWIEPTYPDVNVLACWYKWVEPTSNLRWRSHYAIWYHVCRSRLPTWDSFYPGSSQHYWCRVEPSYLTFPLWKYVDLTCSTLPMTLIKHVSGNTPLVCPDWRRWGPVNNILRGGPVSSCWHCWLLNSSLRLAVPWEKVVMLFWKQWLAIIVHSI